MPPVPEQFAPPSVREAEGMDTERSMPSSSGATR